MIDHGIRCASLMPLHTYVKLYCKEFHCVKDKTIRIKVQPPSLMKKLSEKTGFTSLLGLTEWCPDGSITITLGYDKNTCLKKFYYVMLHEITHCFEHDDVDFDAFPHCYYGWVFWNEFIADYKALYLIDKYNLVDMPEKSYTMDKIITMYKENRYGLDDVIALMLFYDLSTSGNNNLMELKKVCKSVIDGMPKTIDFYYEFIGLLPAEYLGRIDRFRFRNSIVSPDLLFI